MNHLIISEQETEKVFIAHKLQENFAQTLAATKLYLEFAEQSKGDKDEFIHKSLENISGVIDEIKYLCKTMVPSTLGNANPVELLEDMVVEWEAKHNICIDFTCGTSLQAVNGRTGLALFRIIQQQLKLVSCCDAQKAEISISEKDGINLYFTMHGIDFTGTDPQKELFINSISTWVDMINGKMTIDQTLSENDVMQISVPVVEGEVKKIRNKKQRNKE
jgi:signal transduction histidine kinase